MEIGFWEKFEEWQKENNYDNNGVFLAGVYLIMQMPHDKRMGVFKDTANWADEGYVFQEKPIVPVKVTPESGGPEKPSSGKGTSPQKRASQQR